MITVGSPYLPDRGRLWSYLERIYEVGQVSNNGPLVRELEERLKDFLGIDHMLLVANGTLALSVAVKTLNIAGEAVTTPFTFVATSAALSNVGVLPRYADIDPVTLNLDAASAEQALTEHTTALVPVHVYGNPCDVRALGELARRRGLAIVYDAAHALGVDQDGASLLRWGDAATLSFHATKLFHTGEGGGIVFREKEAEERARSLINFGMDQDSGTIRYPGGNAKMSELQAAMGLAVLEDLPDILARRGEILRVYETALQGWVEFPRWSPDATRNGAYAPILLEDQGARDRLWSALERADIHCRPYFYPALSTAPPYHAEQRFRNAEATAARVLCLPVYPGLGDHTVRFICETIKKELSSWAG
ncbi:MAG: DegT/DnrJ/EryC1/StrS family aminotransferase [Thiohalorhabdus sp.]|uniref:DegT/DnrJ/EryC1/StrS family aminotransferase n=1 Tax=Thiohalorhabdus sp. TaxID=3094134 RepID=UPI003981569B